MNSPVIEENGDQVKSPIDVCDETSFEQIKLINRMVYLYKSITILRSASSSQIHPLLKILIG